MRHCLIGFMDDTGLLLHILKTYNKLYLAHKFDLWMRALRNIFLSYKEVMYEEN